MIVLDPQKRRMCHEVTLDCCELSPHQWSMAELFQKNSGRVTLYQEIIEYVYPDVKQYDGITPTAISSIAYRLRRKLAQISPKKNILFLAPASAIAMSRMGRMQPDGLFIFDSGWAVRDPVVAKTTIAADNAMLAVRLEDLREAVFGQNGPTLLNRIEDADRRITDGFEAAKSARLEIRREFLTGSEFSNNLYADRIQTHQNFEEVWERIAHLEHRVTGEQATVRSMNYDGPVRASSHVAR